MYTFCHNFLKYVKECWFEVFVVELRVAYMGVAYQSTTFTKLTDCKMSGWNGHEVVQLSVLKHYNLFMSLVETFD